MMPHKRLVCLLAIIAASLFPNFAHAQVGSVPIEAFLGDYKRAHQACMLFYKFHSVRNNIPRAADSFLDFAVEETNYDVAIGVVNTFVNKWAIDGDNVKSLLTEEEYVRLKADLGSLDDNVKTACNYYRHLQPSRYAFGVTRNEGEMEFPRFESENIPFCGNEIHELNRNLTKNRVDMLEPLQGSISPVCQFEWDLREVFDCGPLCTEALMLCLATTWMSEVEQIQLFIDKYAGLFLASTDQPNE